MEITSINQLWSIISAKAPEYFYPSAFCKWFPSLKPIAMDGSTLVVGVRSDFIQDWVCVHYQAVLEELVESITHRPCHIIIVTIPTDTDS